MAQGDAGVVAGVRPTDVAPNTATFLGALAVVGGRGHVPDTLPRGPPSQLARQLTTSMTHGGTGDIPPLPPPRAGSSS